MRSRRWEDADTVGWHRDGDGTRRRRARAVDHHERVADAIWPGQDITITCIPGLGVTNTTGEDVLTILAKVTSWNTSRDEWAAEVAWQLEAEQRTV